MARAQRVRTDTLRIEGLPQLSRALKALDPDAQKELKDASRKVATFVADDARAAAFSLGGVAAKVAPTIRPGGGVSGGNVGFGGAAQPFAGGAAWGSIRYKQFRPWRGRTGYFPYPQIVSNEDRIESEYGDALDAIIRRHFPLPL